MAVINRIDYNPVVREELLAFVEQKAQVLGLSGPIHLEFAPFQFRDARGPKAVMVCRDSFWNSRVTYSINTDSTGFHHVNELKFGLAHALSRRREPTWKIEGVIEKKFIKQPIVAAITAIVLAILRITAVIQLPLLPFAGCLVAAVAVDLGLRMLVGYTWFFPWQRSLDLKADRKACEICSPAERQAGIDMLTRLRDEGLAYRNAPNLDVGEKWRRQTRTTPEGDPVGVPSPSYNERIRLIQSYA